MRINHSSKVFVSIMYIVTAVSLSLPGYLYLFDYENNFQIKELSDLKDLWLIWLLLLSMVMLIGGGLAGYWNDNIGNHLITMALISGWIFYGIGFFGLCILTSGLVFTTARGLLFFLPSLLLAFTTITTMRLRRKAEK